MMMKIAVKDIKEGSVFSEPVYIEGKNLFAAAGEAVRKKDIQRLEAWGIEVVETAGDIVAPSVGGKAASQQVPAQDGAKKSLATGGAASPLSANGEKDAYRNYLDLIERLNDICNNIAGSITVEARSVDNLTSRIILAVREQRDAFISFILGGNVKQHPMAKSMVNTAILSAFIAIELKLPTKKVMQIITGALLHDVGMLRLPSAIVEKKGVLSAAELQRIQSHPLYTYKIVIKELLYPTEIGLVVLQHHERWDGEGYPRRLSGKAIDIGARIVSVSDAFEAMISQKPYRNSIMGYQAIKNLLADNLRRFDPDVIKAFIQTMGIYPIGSIILLNNGAMARVVNVQKTAPLRPKIKILIDEFGTVFKDNKGDEIDLLVEKSLFIAKSIDPKEAAKKYA